MGEALGLDKEKPNRVTKVAVKMLKCKSADSARAAASPWIPDQLTVVTNCSPLVNAPPS